MREENSFELSSSEENSDGKEESDDEYTVGRMQRKARKRERKLIDKT